jgi:hypothetical protein
MRFSEILLEGQIPIKDRIIDAIKKDSGGE